MGKRKNRSKNNKRSNATSSNNPFEVLDNDADPSLESSASSSNMDATTTDTSAVNSHSSEMSLGSSAGTGRRSKSSLAEPEAPAYDPEALVAALKPRSTLAALGIVLSEPEEYSNAFVSSDETVRLAALQLMAALLHGAADGVTSTDGLESLLIVRIINHPGALDGIVSALSDRNSPEIQISGSDTLLGLSRFVDHVIGLARAASSAEASSDEEGASPSRRRRRHRRTQSNPVLESMLSKLLAAMMDLVDVVNNVSVPKALMSNVARTLAVLSHHDGDLRAQLESRGAYSSLMAAWDESEEPEDQKALFMAVAELRKHTVPQRLAVAGSDSADVMARARASSLGDSASPKRTRPHIVFRWTGEEDEGPVADPSKATYRGGWTAGVAQSSTAAGAHTA